MSELELHDAIVRQSLQLMRLSAGDQARVAGDMKQLGADLKALLDSRALSEATRKDIEALIRDCQALITNSHATMAATVDTQALAIVIAEKTVKALADVLPIDFVGPTAERLASLTKDVMIEGSPASAWWQKQGDDVAFRFANQVRQGVINGEPNARIVQRIVGKRGEPGIFETATRNARSLVQTSVMEAANHARLATYRANSRFIKGVRQISTLDSHTSPICIAYSDAAWDLDGNPIMGNTLPFNGGPPRHWSCRSVLSPIPKTFRDIGLDIDEPTDKGQRASSLGPVAGNTTFDGFLRRQPVAFADKVLGKGRADLWRGGKITLRDLVSGTGRPLTLDQLRDLN